MTSINIILAAFGAFSIAGLYIWLVVALRIGYTHTEQIVEHFKNSPVTRYQGYMKKGGPVQMLHLLGTVMGVIIFSKLYLKNG